MKIFLIHDPLREDREKLFNKELKSQGITTWELVPADKSTTSPVVNIARAHKECIRRIQKQGLPWGVIVEDDVRFVAPGAFNRFISTWVMEANEWDIFISGSYEYKIDHPIKEIIRGVVPLIRFSGLHCYIVNNSVDNNTCNRLLALDENINFDKQISKSGFNVWIAYPMLALQHDGYSDNTKRVTNYDKVYQKNIKVWTNDKE